MIIKSVDLKQFRCHDEYHLECVDETTLILGKNGCGKTSVLEAILVALTGKSFKASDKEMRKRDEDFYRIEVIYENSEKVVVVFDDNGKTFKVGDRKWKRLPVKNRYPVVLFEPDDLNLMATSPSKRRDYFDRFLSQLDDSYAKISSRYKKTLTQRNEILKNDYIDADALFPWDMMLTRLGVAINKRRARMVELINEEITKKYQQIAGVKDEIRLEYRSGVATTEESYLAELMDSIEKDKILKRTNYGTHRDDMIFWFNESEADGSASRGEVRTMILALKFIEAEMLEKAAKKKPLILLDDVFSELDENRQEALKNNFKDNQIIITSVK